MEQTITEIRLESLVESPFNPRKIFTGLEDLAANIQSEGRVHEPLLVRMRPDGHYEIVFGHRRFRAAKLAGLATVPCMYRDMNDAEVRSAQVAENLQRENVHALEEAASYHEMMDKDGLTADELAKAVGKSRSHVYGRLKLLNIHPDVRQQLLTGAIGSEVALLIARLRTEKLQAKALGYIKGKYIELEDGGGRSYRQIRDLLNERFALDLKKDAIFDTADALLLPEAGACTTCPKRTANAPEYADVAAAGREPTEKEFEAMSDEEYERYERTQRGYLRHGGADVCTDPDCFEAKKKAHLKLQAAELESKGKTVVDGAKARQAIDAQGNVKGAYIALKDVKAELKAAAKGATKPEIVTIQDPRSGKTVEAVKREDLKAVGVKVAEPKKKASPHDWQAEQRKRDEEKKEALASAEGAVRFAMLQKVIDVAAAAPRSTLDLQMVAHVAFDGVDYRDKGVLAQLYGGGNREDLHKRIGSMDAAQVALFALTCALVQDVATHTGNYAASSFPKPLAAAAKAYGIDLVALRKSLEAPTAADASTPSSAARAPKKAAAGGAKKPAVKKASPATSTKKAKGTAAKAAEEQTDDAGSAGEQRDLVEEAAE